MHGSVRDGLEDLLAAKKFAGAYEVAEGHLQRCPQCSAELAEFREQSGLFRSLRSPGEMEPGPGFYARVLQRIETSARKSIWWVFVYSSFGKRLAYVSLAMALVLGSYMVAEESRDGGISLAMLHSSQAADHADVPVVGNADQQRDAVLANFASHPGTLQ